MTNATHRRIDAGSSPRAASGLRAAAGLVLVLAAAACSVRPVLSNPGATGRPVHTQLTFSHAAWTTLLQRHVDDDGMVDYDGFARDRAVLVSYLESLAEVSPHQLALPEQKAYWLNAWNAGVVFGVLHYEATDTAAVRGFFDGVRIRCGGQIWSLVEIRDRALRPLGDPRVLLALCPGQRGGPNLRREAYGGSTLDRQLDEQCRQFLADGRKNRIDDGQLRVLLTEPLREFQDDFAVAPFFGLRGFVRHYALPREWLRQEFPIEWMPCDTSLNRR